MIFVIQHNVHQDLFWSTVTGWGDLKEATVFGKWQRESFTPPTKGEWLCLSNPEPSWEQKKILDYSDTFNMQVVGKLLDGRLLVIDRLNPFHPAYLVDERGCFLNLDSLLEKEVLK